MSLFTEQQSKKLIEKIISYSKADEISVAINGSREGNVRFARNTVSTSGETNDLSISIVSVFGKRSGITTINEIEDASLKNAVQRSEEVARLAPENPEYMPGLGAQEYGNGLNYSEKTAGMDQEFRVDAVLASIQECSRNKMTAAGFLQDTTGFVAFGNNKGLFGYNRYTNGAFSVTARSEDEKGSGYGVQYFTDSSQLNTKQVTSIGTKKAEASREAKEMKAEKYTVILEPQAAWDLLSLMMQTMDARTADEGRSFFGKRGTGNRIGDQLFNEKVTIWSDPFSEENPGTPFSNEGLPRQKTIWIENGVLKNLPYSRYWAEQKKKEPLAAAGGSFYVRGSDKSLDDLIKGTDKGILVTRFWYIRAVDPQTLVFTGLTRDGTFYIENGTIKHAIKNFRFNESPAQMLYNLEDVGKPVRINNAMVPSMRIKNFTFTSLSDAV
jgi:predicted Zn-dependent protease